MVVDGGLEGGYSYHHLFSLDSWIYDCLPPPPPFFKLPNQHPEIYSPSTSYSRLGKSHVPFLVPPIQIAPRGAIYNGERAYRITPFFPLGPR